MTSNRMFDGKYNEGLAGSGKESEYPMIMDVIVHNINGISMLRGLELAGALLDKSFLL